MTRTEPWLAPEVRVSSVDRSGNRSVMSLAVDRVTVELRSCGVSTATVRVGALADDAQLPPWRFHDMKEIGPGMRLQVDMRYRGGLPGTLRDGNSELQLTADGANALADWVPVILFRVTELRHDFPSTTADVVEVRGDDLLSLLRRPSETDAVFADSDESDVVSAALRTCAPGIDTQVETTGFQPLPYYQQRQGDSTLSNLLDLARRLDFELHAGFSSPSSPQSSPTIRFERSRARSARDVVDLVRALNVIAFRPVVSVDDVVAKVVALGVDPSTCDEFEASAEPSVIAGELHDSSAESAIDVQRRADQAEGNPTDRTARIHVNGLDKARATRLCEAELLRRANTFLTAEVVTLGLPSLRAGIHVRLHGFDAPFDGHYYVERARHDYDDAGYRTTLQVRRPGWLPPSGYVRAKGTT